MTVEELIEKLNSLPMDSEVMIEHRRTGPEPLVDIMDDPEAKEVYLCDW